MSADTIVKAIPDPFDPASLRLSRDFVGEVAVQRVRAPVEARKPRRDEFIRVNADAAYQVTAATLEFESVLYLVTPDMVPPLLDEVTPVEIVVAVNRHQQAFLWPVKLPKAGCSAIAWHSSARNAAKIAETHWVRVKANQPASSYDAEQAEIDLGAPAFPTETLRDLLRMAFEGRMIDRPDNDVLRKLRGAM